MNEPQRTHQKQVRRWWRAAFVLYAVVLTTATHWPQLELPAAGPDDKTIHVAAFAVFTFLLWQTRWISRRWVTVVVALAWSLLDELGQAIPILNRWCTVPDMVANALGVSIMGMWLWACAPIGHLANRTRIQRHRYLFEQIFARLPTWLYVGGITAMVAVPTYLLIRWFNSDDFTPWLVVAFAVWLFVVAIVLRRAWYDEAEGMLERSPCLYCGRAGLGEVAPACPIDEPGVCPDCAAPVTANQWVEPPGPSRREAVRYAGRPLLVACLLLAGLAVVIVVAIVMHAEAVTNSTRGGGLRWLPGTVRTVTRLQPGLAQTIDLSLYLIVAAILTRMYRVRLAKHYDQHLICQTCGHDLSGTPVNADGASQCGECGTAFVVPV